MRRAKEPWWCWKSDKADLAVFLHLISRPDEVLSIFVFLQALNGHNTTAEVQFLVVNHQTRMESVLLIPAYKRLLRSIAFRGKIGSFWLVVDKQESRINVSVAYNMSFIFMYTMFTFFFFFLPSLSSAKFCIANFWKGRKKRFCIKILMCHVIIIGEFLSQVILLWIWDDSLFCHVYIMEVSV